MINLIFTFPNGTVLGVDSGVLYAGTPTIADDGTTYEWTTILTQDGLTVNEG